MNGDDMDDELQSEAYRLAFADNDFLLREELRSTRLQLEYLKPELIQQDQGINSTVVVFGSARIPDANTAATALAHAEQEASAKPDNADAQRALVSAQHIHANSLYHEEARKLGEIITRDTLLCDMVVMTGGGPGIMEAANRGASEAGGKSIGLNIQLPFEQLPNAYITPELCFQFHYFALRKMHFMKRAKALVAFPGGFGTLDELFDALTLIQTRKIAPLPVILIGKRYWQRIINFEAMVEEGVICPADLQLLQLAETAEEAWATIRAFYGI
ncbi:MAG: TIGR00730 family Rossman fold protein [Halioglobus sp.]